MQLLFLFLLFLCFSSLPLSADDTSPPIRSESVASQEGLPLSIVNNSVCVITGEFVDTQTDLVLPGPEPLLLERTYSSGSRMESDLGYSWTFCFPNRLYAQKLELQRCNEGACQGLNEFNYYAYLTEATGANLRYIQFKAPPSKKLALGLSYPKGYTNSASGELSGRTHVKNQKLNLIDGLSEVEVSEPNGDKRLYSLRVQNGDEYHLRLDKHKKLNQQRVVYTHQKKALTSASAMHNGGTQYSSLKFDYDRSSVSVSSPDNRRVKYHFQRHHHKNYLKRVESTDQPEEKYEYIAGDDYHDLYLSKKTLPDHRYIENLYYHEGINKVGQCEIKLAEDDKRIDRIKEQRAPLGTDPSPIVSHQYVYRISPTERSMTKVTDARGGKTEYEYDEEQRLTGVTKFLGRYGGQPFQKYSMVRYYLGSPHNINKGNLLTKTFEEGSGWMTEAEAYWYDSFGNVSATRLFGNLSGHSNLSVQVGGDGYPHSSGESYGKGFQYSQENHLLLMEEEDNGKKILYSYLPKTDLIATKLTLDRDRVIQREFYEYNDLHVLSKTTIDDGKGSNPNDFAGVTERRITYTYTRHAAPYGLVERKEEKYLDLSTGQEKLLNRIDYSYSPQGRLEREDHSDCNGQYAYSLEWKYDAHGNVTQEIDPLKHITSKQYDANDNLIVKHCYSDPFYTQYEYDYCNRLISEKEIYFDGTCFATYHRYDYLHNRTATIDHFGNETRYVYDDLSRLIETISPPVSEGNAVHRYSYDIYGNKTQTIDPNGNVTKTSYNIHGKPATVQYSNGTVEKFIYNFDGTLQKAIASNGTYTLYSYDVQGRVLAEEIYSSNSQFLNRKSATYSAFHKTSSTDGEGNVTYYRYDGAGRPSATLCGDREENYTYDSLGRLEKTITFYSADQATVKVLGYDFLNRVIEERIEDFLGNTLHKVQYAYDSRGNKTEVRQFTDAGVSVTKMEYNGRNQLTKTTDALGNCTHISYDYKFHNDRNQNVLQTITTDPLGNQTFQTHDALGSIVQIEKRNGINISIACQEMCYDLAGNRVKTTETVFVGDVPQRKVSTTWEYNSVNQVTHLTEAVGTLEQKHTRYSYNSFGQKSALIKPDGVIIHYAYDPIGLLKEIASTDIDYIYTYNCNHQPVLVDDRIQATQTVREYDQNGNLIKEILAHGQTIEYTYDRKGRVTTASTADDLSWQYTYDAAFLRQIDRLRQGEIAYSHHYTDYDLSGLLTKSILPLQTGEIDYCYDLLRRINQIASPQWNFVEAQYDPVGNLVGYTQNDPAGEITNRFSYDSLYQLKSETGNATHRYQSDSLFNRVLKDETSYLVNSLNQLQSQGNCQYQYDPNGNLIAKIDGDNTTTYRYDALDRLIEVTNDTTTTYTYDSFNRRLSKTNDVTIQYLYHDQNEIGALKNGEVIEFRLLGVGKGAEIGAAVALELQQEVYIPIHDHNGNVTVLLNTSGEPVESYRYSAFGEREAFNYQPIPVNPWCFASKRLDPETGFVYFGRRYYAPEIGRWLTPDPIGYQDGPNLYAYLHNNPLLAIDLYGLAKEDRNSMDGPRHDHVPDHLRKPDASDRQQRDNHNGQITRNRDDVNERSAWESFTRGYSLYDAHGITHLGAYIERMDEFQRDADFYERLGMDFRGAMAIFDGYAQVGLMFASEGTINPRAFTCNVTGRSLLASRQVTVAFSTTRPLSSIKPQTTVVKEIASQIAKRTGSRNRFSPDSNASGAHTVFRKDPLTNKISKYETYRPQSNPLDPKAWESVKRYDGYQVNEIHFNKILQKQIQTPHVHDPLTPGGIRPAELWEMPH